MTRILEEPAKRNRTDPEEETAFMTGREMRSLRTQFCAPEQAGTDSGRAALSCPRAPASEKGNNRGAGTKKTAGACAFAAQISKMFSTVPQNAVS